MVLNGESSQEFSVNAGVPQGFILGPTVFPLYINDFSDDGICYADITLYFKCDKASDLWHQIDLASEFESDLLWHLWTGAESGLLILMLKKL